MIKLTSVVRHFGRGAIAAAALIATGAPTQAALVFNFTFTPGTSAQAAQAFIDAGNRWSSLFSDNVVLDMTVGTASLSAGVLTSAGSRRASFTYVDVKNALAADATSLSDMMAVANLDAGSSFDVLINRTADNPNGAGSATPYVDMFGANNSTINITTANAKALGLAVGTGTVGACADTCDASIRFGNAFAYDFDPTDGITAGTFDFVGIATREIGQALGFISGVDILDINSTGTFFNSNQFTFVSTLDLFRYSALSEAVGAIDWTADARDKYFSIDGGATVGPGFSRGRTWGDGFEASAWKDGLGLGIMDPTAALGETLAVSDNDRLAFDVIGWDLKTSAGGAVPEPATWAMMIAGFGLIGFARRRQSLAVRQRRLAQ